MPPEVAGPMRDRCRKGSRCRSRPCSGLEDGRQVPCSRSGSEGRSCSTTRCRGRSSDRTGLKYPKWLSTPSRWPVLQSDLQCRPTPGGGKVVSGLWRALSPAEGEGRPPLCAGAWRRPHRTCAGMCTARSTGGTVSLRGSRVPVLIGPSVTVARRRKPLVSAHHVLRPWLEGRLPLDARGGNLPARLNVGGEGLGTPRLSEGPCPAPRQDEADDLGVVSLRQAALRSARRCPGSRTVQRHWPVRLPGSDATQPAPACDIRPCPPDRFSFGPCVWSARHG